jgi:hypothetical protein
LHELNQQVTFLPQSEFKWGSDYVITADIDDDADKDSITGVVAMTAGLKYQATPQHIAGLDYE